MGQNGRLSQSPWERGSAEPMAHWPGSDGGKCTQPQESRVPCFKESNLTIPGGRHTEAAGWLVQGTGEEDRQEQCTTTEKTGLRKEAVVSEG